MWVKPSACFSGLTLVPHSRDSICEILPLSAAKACSTCLIFAGSAPSLKRNETTWRIGPSAEYEAGADIIMTIAQRERKVSRDFFMGGRGLSTGEVGGVNSK